LPEEGVGESENWAISLYADSHKFFVWFINNG